jgi:hypothetical protein
LELKRNVLEELKKRERIFHRPEYGTKRSDFENMLDAKYWEPVILNAERSQKIPISSLIF